MSYELTTTDLILIMQTIVFTITLIALIAQNRHLTKTLKIKAHQDMVDRIQRLDELIINKPHLGRILNADLTSDNLKDIEKETFIYLILNFFEMIFILKHKDIIDEDEWVPWKKTIIRYINLKHFRDLWIKQIKPNKMFYGPFYDFINNNIKST